MAIYSDLQVGNTWVDIVTTLGVDTSTTALRVQNKGGNKLLVCINDDPTSGDVDGNMYGSGESFILPKGSSSCYLRITSSADITNRVGIENASNLNEISSIPDDLFTSDVNGVRRIAVDSQQTSFEQNYAFRYFDRYDDLAYGSQIVYKVISGVATNLFWRSLSLYAGGREYLIYADSDNIGFTGTLADSGLISPINSNLNAYLTTHPTTQHTIQRAVGSDIFAFVDADNPDTPLDGMLAMTSGNTQQGSSDLSYEGDKLGYESGTYWLVLTHIGSNTNTSGQFKLKWEERQETL